ncbi:DUF6048 family protein [Flagellimonas eckloniae]|uniref:Outer membrane protein beta-barrel domain-containing protein n=1 Tax=Flagellimonas eckloniae TaxID=346185 RepID=A0A0Q0XKL6_9FLAO|nr:DUF6048 family protein [Allomuricauda eckloniae]KQC29504.1 hypothetical protein AAY42_06045 [Allomuricauda eckloniae]
MLKYFISLFFIVIPLLVIGQDKPIDLQPKDTVEYKEEYGLRVGVDLNRLIFSFVDEDYTGLELVGDYRLTQKLYVAAELGNEEKTRSEDLGNSVLYNHTVSGSYLKVGVDMNTYENWFGMNNVISIGGRYAIASFNQTLNDYSIYDTSRFYNPDGFVPGLEPGQKFESLSASWLEFIFGVKAELFANIYMGISARLGFLISNKEDDAFRNLWIPGFNKVTDDSNFGVSYNYTISYFIPLYKKSKKEKEKLPEPE